MNSKKRLNRREKELLGSFERGEWTSSVKSNADLKILKNVAKASQTKDKRINIRIPSRVLEEIQLIALEEGIPYQTLISSVCINLLPED